MSFKEKGIKAYVDYLSKEGRRLVKKAFDTADFNKHRTQNLHDSYGSVVFYNGKKCVGTEYVMTPMAVEPKYNMYDKEEQFGKDEIQKFFNSYQPKTKGFELLVVAAIFYGYVLEKGSGRLKRKYRVISGIDADMNALASQLGGNVFKINMQ